MPRAIEGPSIRPGMPEHGSNSPSFALCWNLLLPNLSYNGRGNRPANGTANGSRAVRGIKSGLSRSLTPKGYRSRQHPASFFDDLIGAGTRSHHRRQHEVRKQPTLRKPPQSPHTLETWVLSAPNRRGIHQNPSPIPIPFTTSENKCPLPPQPNNSRLYHRLQNARAPSILLRAVGGARIRLPLRYPQTNAQIGSPPSKAASRQRDHGAAARLRARLRRGHARCTPVQRPMHAQLWLRFAKPRPRAPASATLPRIFRRKPEASQKAGHRKSRESQIPLTYWQHGAFQRTERPGPARWFVLANLKHTIGRAGELCLPADPKIHRASSVPHGFFEKRIDPVPRGEGIGEAQVLSGSIRKNRTKLRRRVCL